MKWLNLWDLLQKPTCLQNLTKKGSEGEEEEWFGVVRAVDGKAIWGLSERVKSHYKGRACGGSVRQALP